MTIRKKLSMGIGILLILFLALGIISYFQIGQIDEALTQIIEGKASAKRAALLLQRYKTLDDTLMKKKELQNDLFTTATENLKKIDNIITKKMHAIIDVKGPSGHDKMLEALKIKACIGEAATSLRTFLWSPNEENERRVFENVGIAEQELRRLGSLRLTEEQINSATELEAAFGRTVSLIKEIVTLSNYLQENAPELADLRAKINGLLNEELEVFTRVDLERAKEAGRKTVGTTVMVTLILVITGFLDVSVFSATITRSITKPIVELKNAVAEIGKGDFDAKIEIGSNDEIGELAGVFKQMAERRRQAEEGLRQARDELEVRVEERTVELLRANEVLELEIDERQKAEHALERLNTDLESSVRELTRSNKELQELSYIAAHDLKTPLRGIVTLADWISTDYAEMFDEEGKEQINLLIARTKQVDALLDSVLQYSSLGQSEQQKREVDLNKVLSEVIDTIAPPKNIKICVENVLPVLTCQRAHITQVFHHLLSNAIRHGGKPEGQIKVGCVEQDGFWQFSVTDNGPGIDRKYFEKIFRVFQTLSPRDHAQGTGIGLSVVKKIVELNAGSVWVESELGKGSTFFFTMPKSGVRQESNFQMSSADANSYLPAGVRMSTKGDLSRPSGVLYEERQLTSHMNKIIDTKKQGKKPGLSGL